MSSGEMAYPPKGGGKKGGGKFNNPKGFQPQQGFKGASKGWQQLPGGWKGTGKGNFGYQGKGQFKGATPNRFNEFVMNSFGLDASQIDLSKAY